MRFFFTLLFVVIAQFKYSQGYTSFFTGNPNDVQVTPNFGICLMGGATENDQAMIWLLQKANGGDVVVLRTSGTDGYNNYFYSQLGVNVNSVETLVITSVAGATNPYVLDKVAKAEMIWLAGGNQANYVNFFKNNALGDLLNAHVNQKNAPIGGTSAGMAILGSHYYSALNNSVTSAQALTNPYHSNITLGANDFLLFPWMENTITDTHFENPDRRGRLTTFLARFQADNGVKVRGIACEEYTAVCIEANGQARVFGSFPNFQDYAYFVQANCEINTIPQQVLLNQPLQWSYPSGALKVYKAPGTNTGQNYFSLNDWQNEITVGGVWEHWNVVNGVFQTVSGSAPQNCTLNVDEAEVLAIQVYPVPATDRIFLTGIQPKSNYQILDFNGRIISSGVIDNTIKFTATKGMYLLKIWDANGVLKSTFKFTKN